MAEATAPAAARPPATSVSTSPSPSSPAAQERIRQIMQAATAVMGRQGYANTSMKDIAREAGVAQGLIHYYFGSKEDLLVAVVRNLNQEMLAGVAAAMADAGNDPLAQIWASLRSVRDGFGARPEFLHLYFDLVTLSFSNEAVRTEVAQLSRELTAATAEMCARLDENLPTPLPVPREDFASVLVAAIDGVMLRSVIDPEYDREALYRALGFLTMSCASCSYWMAGQVPPLESFEGIIPPADVIAPPAASPAHGDEV